MAVRVMGAFRMMLISSSLVLSLAYEILEEVDTALTQDDACDAHVDGGCALNALQMRSERMRAVAALSSEANATEGMASSGAAQGHPVINLEVYRAMRSKDLDLEFANVDVASIAGVLSYLHTEVVGEHVDDYGGWNKKARKHRMNRIDALTSMPLHVRNPDPIIDTFGAVGHFVDFAPSAHFINGQATGPQYNWNFGDLVGAKRVEEPSYPTLEPYYQFSLSGFCPNLRFKLKEKGAKKAYAAQKASATGRRRRHKNLCMTYADKPYLPYGKVLQGGLCRNGTEPGKVPTGAVGCIYTYDPPKKKDVVSLDELVGITKERCGHRPCENFEDFRKHCSSRRYKRKFNYRSRRRYSSLVKSKRCVEYDIHKACAKSCTSKACLKVPAHRRELGLPFWRGRCSAVANAKRAEALAMAFGIAGANETHRPLRAIRAETCLLSDEKAMCHPNVTTGGMYCTRSFSGVCQPCYIPGTVADYPNKSTTPVCHWDVLTYNGDYANLKPNCSSNLPSDLCCLFGSTCNQTLMKGPWNLDEDGFAVVASLKSTETMAGYLTKAFSRAFNRTAPSDKVAGVAYWAWGLGPVEGSTLESTLAKLK